MSARSSILSIAVFAALSLSACDATSAPDGTAAEPASFAPPTQAASLTPSGAPETLTVADASEGDDGLQWAAGVVRVDPIPGESAKLFGTAGGDPAMNGLYTYIAFFHSPAEGWAVYRIGDFLDYTVLSHANGRVDLDVQESTYDEASGEIGDRRRKIIVQWTQGPNDQTPTAVTATPAR
ncbi:MAG: hypothetical protein KKA16_08260 [Alphaproteobacteria bacterium]|nr:hypothetical protein [Alphaproteobacteria bacterium]MBU2379750.1 hypothetical protein [Alphaproteobacteria bacterium]